MIIEKLHLGEHGKTIKYAVCADVTETGDRLHEIARFDTLETAVIVLKYMRGDELINISDEQTAREAIRKAATEPAKVQATA